MPVACEKEMMRTAYSTGESELKVLRTREFRVVIHPRTTVVFINIPLDEE
jgi:hypothetical protein